MVVSVNKNTRFIVVVGGVMSGVGKGVCTASIGKIMHEHGYKTTLVKIDPYINYDAGTLRPTEHGEVWVTDDGGEIDQDLGTYERFMNIDIPKKNNLTTGQIYKSVIDRERAGHYLGQTVQFIPHITDEVTRRICAAAEGHEVVIIEIGGTVGDYENVPFLFSLKALERELGSDHVAYVLVTYLPVPGHIGEMKTKPTQQAIRMLGEQGIMPDFIICRSQQPLDVSRRKKIEVFANITADHIIAAPDVVSVYQMPLELERQKLGAKLLSHLKLELRQQPDWVAWNQRVEHIINPQKQVRIAVVGKYLDSGDFSLTDSYLSICHALIHAGAEQNAGVAITWIDAKQFEADSSLLSQLNTYDGIIIPGGFGNSGVEGKIAVIKYARTHGIPFLGLCYGLQLAVVEFARHVCSLTDAHTTEVNQNTPHPVIDILPWQKELLDHKQYGGTMRLGLYKAAIREGTRVHTVYSNALDAHKSTQSMYKGALLIGERHRHRYEVNPNYVSVLQEAGFVFSGSYTREDGTQLMEYGEITSHPFFIATQAHPEFKSRLGNPNPLFYGFVSACYNRAF
jgi:CTP synthase